eukprot:gene15616-biopygen24643
MAWSNHQGRDITQSSEDALWVCREALLPRFDSEMLGIWRLVCKQACKAVGATTQYLKWDGDTNGDDSEPDMTILHKCPALRRLRLLKAPRGLSLTGLPHSLRALDVQLRPDNEDDADHQDGSPEVEELSDLPISAALSPLTALTKLEETVLHGFLDSSLAALEFCTALRSLDLSTWPSLTDITALIPFGGYSQPFKAVP